VYVGASLILLAAGAILRYAVADTVDNVDLPMIGMILMVVGAIGLVVSLIQTAVWRERRDREVVVERDHRHLV
jgi:hypothetical protein